MAYGINIKSGINGSCNKITSVGKLVDYQTASPSTAIGSILSA